LVAENEGNLTAIAQELEVQSATSEYHLGGVLYHIKKSGEYKTVDDGAYDKDGGWNEYVQTYFNVQYRKAQYLIEIYTAFSLKNITDAASVVAQMGWSKAAKIARPMLDGFDAEELIEAASNNTVEDLSTIVKETTHEGGSAGTKGDRINKITIKFRLANDDAVTANSVLTQAMEELGVKDIADALMVILTDYAANNQRGAESEADEAQQRAPAARKAAAKKTVAHA
jgi:hypothetical protein